MRELGGHYLELAGPLAPWGEIRLCPAVGGALSAHDAARLWLDRLAPLPGAWSSVGGAGAAAFTRLVAEAFQFAWLGAPELPCARRRSGCRCASAIFMLAERLLEAAQRYLALHPQEGSFAALLASFLVEAVSLGREADAMLRDWLAAQRPPMLRAERCAAACLYPRQCRVLGEILTNPVK